MTRKCTDEARNGLIDLLFETSQALEPNATITNAALALCDRGRSLSGAEDVRRRDWCTFYGGTHRPTRSSCKLSLGTRYLDL